MLNQSQPFCLLSVTWVLISSAGATLVSAQDQVVMRDSRQREVTRQGQIVDFNRRRLALKSRQGVDVEIPSAKVIRVETSYVPEQVAADKLFREHNFAEALRSYRAAFRIEKRTWVRRQILAQVVWCHRNLNQIQPAVSSFTLLMGNNAETRFFDAIPLAWRPHQPSAPLANQAKQWLNDRKVPAFQRLIAASWLLSSADRFSAVETLRQLTRDQDSRIQQLALAQLWRSQRATSSREEVVSVWTTKIRALPTELRGGPYYVLGRALTRHGENDLAVLAFMHVPIEYPRLHELAAESLYEAGQLLETTGDRSAARRVFEELVGDYPDTTASAQAADQLRAMQDG